MSRNTTSLLVATLLVIAASAPAAAVTHDETGPTIQEYAEGPSFIIEYEDGKLSSLQSWANASDDRKIVRVHNASNTATVAGPKATIVDSLFARASSMKLLATPLEDRSYVVSVRPNYVLQNSEPVATLDNESSWEPPKQGRLRVLDDPYPTDGVAFDNANQTTLAEAGDVTGAGNMTATGSGQTAAVIDTGCNVAGGSLGVQGDIHNKSASFLGDGVTTVNDSGYDAIEDKNGHGSWVAASITGNSSYNKLDGIAPKSTILCLKALDSEGSGSTSDIAAAIRYAADANASVDVLTMSLGSSVWSDTLNESIAYALNTSDIKAVTVASGNSRQTVKFVGSPGDATGVIAVGAATGQPPASAESAYFSQVSGQSAADGSLKGDESVDVSAPGMRVMTRVPTTVGGGENRSLSGTSMATPIVAGNILLALEANSTLAGMNHTGVHDAVTSTARPAKQMAVAETGHGVIAGDNLASGTTPSTSQEDARTTAAKERDAYYRGLAESSGGIVTDIRGLIGGAS